MVKELGGNMGGGLEGEISAVGLRSYCVLVQMMGSRPVALLDSRESGVIVGCRD